jgi:histidinol-phosphate/aromatic aminotransferase/cobyric acid decarboxylase-like protein
MSDTPRTDAAYFAEGATMYDLAGEAKKMERELNEANADRQRLRQALTQAGAGQFLDTISATPLPAVVDKRDADALADALEKMEFSAHSHHDLPMCPKCLRIPAWGELHREDCLFNSLQTYRTKYP